MGTGSISTKHDLQSLLHSGLPRDSAVCTLEIRSRHSCKHSFKRGLLRSFSAEWTALPFVRRIIGQECDGNEGKRLWAVARSLGHEFEMNSLARSSVSFLSQVK